MDDYTMSRLGLVVITNQLNEDNAAFTAVQNFIDIYDESAESITIFGPEQTSLEDGIVQLHEMKRHDRPTTIHEIVYHLYLQLRLTLALVRNQDDLDVVFFHLGGTILLIPLLFSRILGLNPVIIVTGSVKKSYLEQHEKTAITRTISTVIDVLETSSSRVASRVVFLSETMKSQFRSIDDDRTTVANLNYIDIEKFNNDIPESERKFDLIYVGRFEQVKGVKKFIQAISILAEKRPEIRVALAGDGTLMADVEQIIAEDDLEDNVELLGWVKRGRIPKLLGNSRYLVLPSESEGVPKTLLEAMSCGTVPIATNVGGVPDIVEPRETGYLLSTNKPGEMASEILGFIDQSEWRELSLNARKYIVSSNSLMNRKRDYVLLLREVL